MSSTSDISRYVGFIVMAVLAMSVQAIAMKYISDSYTIIQITIYRSAIIILALIAIAILFVQARPTKPNSWTWIASRSLLMVSMNFFYYGSLPLMDISIAATAFYTGPVFIVLLAALLANEKVNFFSVIAILSAFFGTYLVIQPGEADFSIAILFPILSAMTYAFASIITRLKCQEESVATMLFGVHIAFLLVSAALQMLKLAIGDRLLMVIDYPFITGEWIPFSMNLLGVMVILALLNTLTHLGFAKAYQSRNSSVIATWEYTYLVFVVVLGFIVFGEIPDVSTAVGMAIIVASGILILYADRLPNMFGRRRRLQ